MVARRLTEGITPYGNDDVLLVGPPHEVRGTLRVRNDTESRRTVRRGLVRGEVLPAEAAEVMCHVGPQRIGPGEIVTTKVAVEVPSATPPGDFEIEIEVGGTAVHARAVVFEVVETDVTPSTIVVEASSGRAISRRVAIRNTGNVPVVVGEIGAVVLDDELLDCRTMRGALAELTQPSVTIEQVLGAIARNAKAALEQAGLLRVHNASGRQTIEPGTAVVLDLEVRVPPHLDRHTRYYGRAYIGTSELTFRIVPGPHRATRAHRDT